MDQAHAIADFSNRDVNAKNALVNLIAMNLDVAPRFETSFPTLTPTLKYFVASLPQVRNAAVSNSVPGVFRLADNFDPNKLGGTFAITVTQPPSDMPALLAPYVTNVQLDNITPPDALSGLGKGLPSVQTLALDYGPVLATLQEIDNDVQVLEAGLDDFKLFFLSGKQFVDTIKSLLAGVTKENIPALIEQLKLQEQLKQYAHTALVQLKTKAVTEITNLGPPVDSLTLSLDPGGLIEITTELLLGTQDLDLTKPAIPKYDRTVTYSLTNLALRLEDWVTFRFRSVTFVYTIGGSPRVTVDPSGATLGNQFGALVGALEKLLGQVTPTIGFKDNYFFTGLSLHLDDIDSGAFSLRNLALRFSVGLPLALEAPKASFAIGSQLAPLALAIGIYTGWAYFELDTPPVSFALSLDFGASAALDFFGLASGLAETSVGFYISPYEVDMHLHCHGHLAICGGVVSADVEILL